eukprot:6192935-Pleurochrysis_carterae.AAC.3
MPPLACCDCNCVHNPADAAVARIHAGRAHAHAPRRVADNLSTHRQLEHAQPGTRRRHAHARAAICARRNRARERARRLAVALVFLPLTIIITIIIIKTLRG